MSTRTIGDRCRRDALTEWVTARTRFVDDAVVRALGDGVAQIVLLGAGYDSRALRFRTPGVTFFEVDHPATQADKRERLAAVDASTDGIEFVAADFNEPGLAEALAAHGHVPARGHSSSARACSATSPSSGSGRCSSRPPR